MTYKGYSKITECTSFWSWFYYEIDTPEGARHDLRWYKHCGSPHRCRFVRILGHEYEEIYYRKGEN